MTQDHRASKRRRRTIATAIASVAAFIACCATAAAATYNVPCGDVYGQRGLVHAIDAANHSGGTVNLATCRYVLTHPVIGRTGLPVISGRVTINGRGAEIVRASNAGPLRFFFVDKGGRLDLRQLTLRNGFLPAGGTARSGGAISVATGGSLRVSASTLRDNHVDGYGGAVLSTGTASISDSRIVTNTAHTGGGGGIVTEGRMSIADSQISRNTVTLRGDAETTHFAAQGGGLINFADGILRVRDSTIDGNRVSATGNSAFAQAAGVGNFGYLALSHTWVGRNSAFASGSQATAAGGGIGNRRGRGDNAPGHGQVVVERTAVTQNSATVTGSGAFVAFGGGIANAFRGAALVTASDVSNNSVTGNGPNARAAGGGIGNGDLTNSNSVTTVRRSAITKNVAGGSNPHGGGIARLSGSVSLSQTAVRRNVPDQCYPSGTIPRCTG